MIVINEEQAEVLDIIIGEQQVRAAGQALADNIQNSDPDTATKIRKYTKGSDIEFLQKLMNLSSINEYWQYLFLLYINTSYDIFNETSHEYILNHPLLGGDAKSRHIAVSAHVALSMRGKP